MFQEIKRKVKMKIRTKRLFLKESKIVKKARNEKYIT